MNTDFYLQTTGITVDKNYTWDNGNPFITGTLLQNTNTTNTGVTGYAPYLNVTVTNNSTVSSTAINQLFIINFGDFYNDNTNIQVLSCTSFDVQHLYLYPGSYTITLTQINGFATTPISATQITSKTIVTVLEKLPQALIYNLTQPLTGTSPHTVQLTPRYCLPGSFPIERIDWDFNDGTPIQTVTRYSTPNNNLFVNNEIFWKDSQDPRNFDAIYTYKRSLDTYSVFYPSITCYSSSTNTSDSCSTIVGPISLPKQSSQINLIKVRNTPKSNFYCLDFNNTLGTVVAITGTNTPALQSNIPLNKLRNNTLSITKYGNNIFYYPGVVSNTEIGLPYAITSNAQLTSTFSISSISFTSQTSSSQDFIVSVGGLVQPPSEYTLNLNLSTITFTTPISANIPVYVLKLYNNRALSNYTLSGWFAEFTPTTPIQTLSLTAGKLISDTSRYFVSIDGIPQSPNSYTITPQASTISFSTSVLSGLPITVIPLPTINNTTQTITIPLCGLSETVSKPGFWTFQTKTTPTTYYYLYGDSVLTSRPEGYLVTIGGILQKPTDYTIDALNRFLILSNTPPDNTPITVVQPNNIKYTKAVLKLYQQNC